LPATIGCECSRSEAEQRHPTARSRGIDRTSGGQERSKLSQTVRNQRLLVSIALEAGTLAYCRRGRYDKHRILRNPVRRPAARLKSYLMPKGGIERLWAHFASRFAPREIRWPRAELNHGYQGRPVGTLNFAVARQCTTDQALSRGSMRQVPWSRRLVFGIETQFAPKSRFASDRREMAADVVRGPKGARIEEVRSP